MNNTTDKNEEDEVQEAEVFDTTSHTHDEEDLSLVQGVIKGAVNNNRLRKIAVEAYAERLEYQQTILRQRYLLGASIAKQTLFNEYMSKIGVVEKEAIDKLNNLSLQGDEQVKNAKDEVYDFFDSALEDIKKWADNPARYDREKQYLDTQLEKKLNGIQNNADKLYDKTDKMLDETMKLFKENDEKIKLKFNNIL